MIIFAIILFFIFFLLLKKIKINIYFKFDNLETYFKLKFCFIEIKKKGTLVKRKKKYVIRNKTSKLKSIDKKEILKSLKYVEVNKLNVNAAIGLIMLFPTITVVPLIATLLEYIKLTPFKKIVNYNYNVIPVYNRPKFFFEIDTTISIKIIDIIKLALKLIRASFILINYNAINLIFNYIV